MVRAAPTKIPIPKTDIAFNRFPALLVSVPCCPSTLQHIETDNLPEVVDLNIRGNPPTNIDAANMQTHCINRIKIAILVLSYIDRNLSHTSKK
jgi:hypothetical protein